MKKQSFNLGWRFILGDPVSPHKWHDADDSTWRVLDLPHDWSIELERSPNNPSGVSNGWFPMGRAWYRKTFTVPEDWLGKKVFIEFEGIYMNAEVWLNQHLLARHPYGYTSFIVDLTPALKIGELNTLRVHVDNVNQTNSRWYSGSGIYRPVWLLVCEPIHIAQYGIYVTTPEVSTQNAIVRVNTLVQNESDTRQKIYVHSTISSPDESEMAHEISSLELGAAESGELKQELSVTNPRLWSVDSPSLYRMETEIVVGESITDVASTEFGIRTIKFSAEEGFLLNSQPMKLKGGCVHHDNGILGAASYPQSEERKVSLLKASGFNAIRCAHNPPAPSMLDACDRLGMLVMDEAFDCWRIGKNPYDYHTIYEDWWQRDLDSMLYRDRNHPSIIMWSIGNEVLERDGRSDGVKIAESLAERVRQVDPSRPVTSAICGVWDNLYTWEDTDGVFSKLDVGGYNYLWQKYQSDHQRHPERIMVGTESFPMEALDNWQAVLDNPFVIGDFVWTSLDYLGESGIGRVHPNETAFLGAYPWHQANCGDLDICGFKRPQSYYRDIVWKNDRPLYIAVHTPVPEDKPLTVSRWGWPDVWPNWNWHGFEQKPIKVDVYSTCDQVELFLNDHSLGVRKTSLAERFMATYEVLYVPGELKAVGYYPNGQTAEFIVNTIGSPASIRLVPDCNAVRADEICFITVEVVDQDGRVHPAAENTLSFAVQGTGNLLAIGNSNPTSTELYRGNQRSVYHGRCLVVVKGNAIGEMKLYAQGDGLNRAETSIMVKSSL